MENKRLFEEDDIKDLKLMIALSRTTKRVHARSATIFMTGGLTASRFAVLEALYHKGPLTIQQIIDAVLSTPGNMTVVISNLVRDGLARRTVNAQDNRSAFIEITEKGRSYIQEIFPHHVIDLKDSFSDLSEEEKDQLIHLLKRIK
ncbi:MarR family transcriptional regulator [uncultured Sphaerochaeta sp.]|uniref:MarR family winged helix-turn-helix transcriptional regulator n=1 Tax=uncultured Sphaerochaeta sp. TaxID=886478 RepID=UPI002A0A5B67|nr:MarR family transcriptional regulator [uncultured Sphaerochaeta sp.]